MHVKIFHWVYKATCLNSRNQLAAGIWFNPRTEEDALHVYREKCLLQPNLTRIESVVYEKVDISF
jgi:hypothetical protein